MNRAIIFVIIGFLVLSACSEESVPVSEIIIVSEIQPDSTDRPPVCTPSWEAGISIRVLDNETGNSISSDATATLQDGDYIEQIDNYFNDDGVQLSGAFERPGTYDIRVSKPGYIDGVIFDVPVTRGGCHVNTTILEAYLRQ